jgi:FkbM family methyltransferase
LEDFVSTPEEVWAKVAEIAPAFKHEHDVSGNFRAVEEIVAGGSLTWRRAHELYQPKPGHHVLDVGANAGIYSAFCAAHGAMVMAFECGQNSFNLLEKMMYQSKLNASIIPMKVAVTGKNGLRQIVEHGIENNGLFYYNGGLETIGVKWGAEDLAKSEYVPGLSLDFILKEYWSNVEVNCMKVDVEGAEAEILLAASQATLRRIKFMYIEIHEWIGPNLYHNLVEWLRSTCSSLEGYTQPQTGLYEALYVRNW